MIARLSVYLGGFGLHFIILPYKMINICYGDILIDFIVHF